MVLLGIDFGKFSSKASVIKDGAVEPVIFDDGTASIPSVVALTETGWRAGGLARNAMAGPHNLVVDLSNLIGRKMADFTSTQLSQWSFRLVYSTAGKAMVEFTVPSGSPPRLVSAEELVAVLFRVIKRCAENQFQSTICQVVIAVPAAFNRTQRQAVRDACEIAGLKAVYVIASSTAVGIAKFICTQIPSSRPVPSCTVHHEHVVVVDYGAGSLDISLLRLTTDTIPRVEVKSVMGHLNIGGDELSNRIVNYFLDERGGGHSEPVLFTHTFLHRLRQACHMAKRILTTSESASIQVVSPTSVGNFEGSITRSTFEAICADVWNQLTILLDYTLQHCIITKSEVERVVLSGGTAKIPLVQTLVTKYFNRAAINLVDEREVLAARGAAICAAYFSIQTARTWRFRDVTPLTLGLRRVGHLDGTVIVPPETPIPSKMCKVLFATAHSEVIYQVIEGGDMILKDRSNEFQWIHDSNVHQLGILCIPRHKTTPQLVVKVEVIFDIDECDHLGVTATILPNGKPLQVIYHGDETIISRDDLIRARTQLAEQSVNIAIPNEPVQFKCTTSIDTLRTYASTLQIMIQRDKLEISLPTREKHALLAKIKTILTMIETPSVFTNDTCRSDQSEGIQTLQRLYYTTIASCALSALKDL